jgi:chromosome segregation ATPase
MGGRKQQQGIEGTAGRLRARLADTEAALQALTEAIERDGEQDEDDVRAQLGELHEQAAALVAKAEGLLERAREVVADAEQRAENGGEFVSAFEDLVSGLQSASETLDPENWDWGGQGEEDGGDGG